MGGFRVREVILLCAATFVAGVATGLTARLIVELYWTVRCAFGI